MKIKINELENIIIEAFENQGLSNEYATKMADVFVRAQKRMVGHHDFNALEGRLKALKEERINSNPKLSTISEFGAIAAYDGDNGLGELMSYIAMEKAMELANEFGIGYVTIRNSNHFLSAAPFVQLAAEKDYFGMMFSKSPGGLSLENVNRNVMGNNPFGFGTSGGEEKILFDICVAYSSFGKMKAYADEGVEIPSYYGRDKNGVPTTVAKELLESGLYNPIGGHKGFGIGMMIEILTAVMGQGNILNQNESTTNIKGNYTQSAICIDIKRLMEPSIYHARIKQMIEILKGFSEDIRMPGERSQKFALEIEESGEFEIDDGFIEMLNLYRK